MTQPSLPSEDPLEIVAVLRWRDEQGRKLERNLRQGDLVIFGRDAEADGIALPSLRVSRRHAVLSWRKNRFVLRDLGSTNGTQVNGKRIKKSKRLLPGDLLEFGDFKVSFFAVGDNLTEHAIDTVVLQKVLHPYLIATSGPHEGVQVSLSNEMNIIGRDEGDSHFTLALNDPTTSAPHVFIMMSDNGFVLADLGSETGTKVNGKSVEAALPLNDGDVIQIGVSNFLFRID